MRSIAAEFRHLVALLQDGLAPSRSSSSNEKTATMPQPTTTSTRSGRSLGPLLRPRALGPRALLLIAAAQLSASAEPGVHAVLGGLEARASTNLRSLPTGAECYTVSGGMSSAMGISGDYEHAPAERAR